MSHKECVKVAAEYMSKRAPVVLPEFFSWNSELPDVMAFSSRHTTMVECKVSRNDFLADKKKHHRAWPEQGMGDFRYYCCPKGLIKPEELPDNWGLIYVYPSGKPRRVVEASRQPQKDTKAEYHLLFYYARRANFAGVHNAILDYRGFDS